jgi:hypothetical protein
MSNYTAPCLPFRPTPEKKKKKMEHFWVQNGHMCSTISCLICSRREMLCQDPRKTTPWCLSKLLENPNYSSTLKEPKITSRT